LKIILFSSDRQKPGDPMTPARLILILLLFVVCGFFVSGCVSQPAAENRTGITPVSIPAKETPLPKGPAWKYGGVAIEGQYADADVVDLGNGRFRLYYATEPEVPGNKLEVFSAVSDDGMNWEKEPGVRREFSVFPDVVKLPDGRFRMYFQTMGVIKSAVSRDGLSWTDEPGVRIDTENTAGLNLENVAAPSTIRTGDQYIMVYRGTINQRYSADVPNANTQLLLYATSGDGLDFERKGIALDSRNVQFNGLLDGPDLVQWDDGSIRLYLWSYRGVFHTQYEGGSFSKTPQFDYTTQTASGMPFPPDPPCDPTVAKIKNRWYMYYGIHTKGIQYATLDQ
jgi:hypothetical protein